MPCLTDADLYGDPYRMPISGRYAMFRYLTHLADHAPVKPAYADELAAIECDRMHPAARALMRACFEDAVAAIECLTPAQARVLADARPATPMLQLSETPVWLDNYLRWGILI